MAARSPFSLFQIDDVYKDVHRIVAENKPVGNFEDGIAVAVLQHGKSLSAENFLWFKVKEKHSIAKLRAGYKKRVGIEAVFRFAGHHVPDELQIRSLNLLGDNLVVFIAHEAATMTSLSSSSRPESLARTPFKSLNSQLHNVPAAIKSEPKIEAPSLSSLRGSYLQVQNARFAAGLVASVPPDPMPIKIKDENAVLNSNFFQSPHEHQRSQPIGPGVAGFAPGNSHFYPGAISSPTPEIERLNAHTSVEPENSLRDLPMGDIEPSTISSMPTHASRFTRLQKIIEEGFPERLEAEVRKNQSLLDNLKIKLAGATEQSDVRSFLQQIETLRNEKIDTPTIIGVVGNTGAGKSSVINAILEEERLVPTNCMRACTAVVTEMSWNTSDDENAKYRADIEFIQASDWEKDLRLSLTELIDSSGQVSKECHNPDSEAGVAYAKIKAVYPNKTNKMLASSTVEQLMNEPGVRELLGETRKIEKARPEPFYRALQHYVDSKEKTTGQKKKETGEKKSMEFWPLIKVVRIYTKADVLSTGAVIVDLPGVHDSNAARAAVAAGYMKQCTGLWIVAPITRAVDDKAAKSLLGESFKRQLKYDGIYSRVTFICSKTDDISIMEASNSLNLEEQMSEDWAKIDDIDGKIRGLKKSLKELRDSRGLYSELVNDADDEIEKWESLKDDLEDGKEVWPPSDKSKKRKRSAEPGQRAKKSKRSIADGDDSNDGSDLEDEEHDSEASEAESDPEPEKGDPLTMEAIEEKLSQLKEDKKRARKERSSLDAKSKTLNEEIDALDKEKDAIERAISAICIKGRNDYSKGAIQTDFAAGIKELDQENAQEQDETNFNPEEDIRDYEEVARSLPVFCCSARAYQQMSGRLQRDSAVPGFRSLEETEIPQLQQHCKHLTEGVRTSNCRRFLTNFSQLMNSLSLWASNDGTGIMISDAQRTAETRFLKSRLQKLEASLDKAVKDCLSDMNEALAENIFENFGDVIQQAAAQALPTARKWGAPVNKENREAGGFYWATYKALCRRNGIFTNAVGSHDLNLQLCEPIIKHLAGHWEKAFARRLPGVLQSFTRKSKGLLTAFHQEIEARSMKQGVGTAGLAMLGQQLRNYEAIFANFTAQMIEVINTLQRDANREFTPVIASKLASAYEWCAAEVGGGQFMRMKEHMTSHVSSNLDMFAESCEEVKKRLIDMCGQVAKSMASKADEVFTNMSRDYTEVISGTRVEGQMMPKWERLMRAEIAKAIEDSEMADEELEDSSQTAGLADFHEDNTKKEGSIEEDRISGDTKSKQSSPF